MTLSVEGSGAGITAILSDVHYVGALTQGTVTVTAALTATVGVHDLSVKATGVGLSAARSFSLTVSAHKR